MCRLLWWSNVEKVTVITFGIQRRRPTPKYTSTQEQSLKQSFNPESLIHLYLYSLIRSVIWMILKWYLKCDHYFFFNSTVNQIVTAIIINYSLVLYKPSNYLLTILMINLIRKECFRLNVTKPSNDRTFTKSSANLWFRMWIRWKMVWGTGENGRTTCQAKGP